MADWVVYLLISGAAFLIAHLLRDPEEKTLETDFGDGRRVLKNGRWIKKEK